MKKRKFSNKIYGPGIKRKFGNKTYNLGMTVSYKKMAQEIANDHKKEGGLARIVKAPDGWSVYYISKRNR